VVLEPHRLFLEVALLTLAAAVAQHLHLAGRKALVALEAVAQRYIKQRELLALPTLAVAAVALAMAAVEIMLAAQAAPASSFFATQSLFRP
jgi:hypothetical protein